MLFVALVCSAFSSYLDIPPPPERPLRFKTKEQIENYLKAVKDYYDAFKIKLVRRNEPFNDLSLQHLINQINNEEPEEDDLMGHAYPRRRFRVRRSVKQAAWSSRFSLAWSKTIGVFAFCSLTFSLSLSLFNILSLWRTISIFFISILSDLVSRSIDQAWGVGIKNAQSSFPLQSLTFRNRTTRSSPLTGFRWATQRLSTTSLLNWSTIA